MKSNLNRLILPLLLSVGLAALAQYLFQQPDSGGFVPVVLYVAAGLLFVFVLQQAQAESVADASLSRMQLLARRLLQTLPWQLGFFCLALVFSLVGAWDVMRSDHPEPYTLAIAMWVLSIAALVCAFIPWPQMRKWNVRQAVVALRPIRFEIAFVVGLVLAAFIVRTVNLEHIPVNFAGDEGEMGLQARAFLTGDLQNPFATSWMTHQTMWFWLQSFFIGLLGQSAWPLRLLSVILGTLSILATYLLIRDLFGRPLAVITGVLLAFYSFHLHFSRIAISAIADPFWTPLILFLVYRSVTTKRIGYYVAAGIASGYSQYFYHGARLIPVVVVVWLGYWFLQNRSLFLSQLKNFLTLVTAGLVTAAPLIVYYLNNPSLFVEHYNAMGIIPSGWLSRTMAATGQSAIAILLDRTGRTFLFFNSIPDYSGFYAPHTPLLEPISATLLVFGFAYAIYRIKDYHYFLVVSWFVLALILGAVLINDENGSERLLTTTVPVMFFVGLGLFKLVELFSRLVSLRPRWQWGLVGLLVAVIALVNVKFYFVDYTPMRTYSGDGGSMFTDMAHYLAAQTGDFKVYFFGAPYDFITHGTVQYLAPGIDGMDVADPLTGPPDFVDISSRAIFIFTPKRPNDFQYVHTAYPDGKRVDFSKPNGDQLFYIYVVDDPGAAEKSP
ncbi:MAG: glycosyltransferase family 39 protein [Anaerolineae bacterium]